jgi:cysteine desulfurase/selenocysteine lyase
MYGPFGVGVVYGKEKWLEQMPPYQSGGEMIKDVSFEKSTFNELPFKFEAGTPNVADVVAFRTAIEFIEKTGYNVIAEQEEKLLRYATEKLQKFENLEIYGKADNKSAVISFNLKGMHHYDAGVILDRMGIAVRTGHHCTQPLMDFFKIPGTIRASFAVYNTKEEIDYFIEALTKTQQMLS